MGYLLGEMTAKELAKKEGVNIRAIGIPFAKYHREGNPLFPAKFSQDLQLTEDQILALRPKRAKAQKEKVKQTDSVAASFAANVPMNTEQGWPNEVAPQGGQKWFTIPENWRTKLFAVFAFLLVTGHAGLIWYDMHLLWKMPGQIGGGVVFVFILSGMVLMSEKSEKMEDVRENMLWAVGFLEALAIFVHRGAFSRNGGEAYAAGMGVEYIWAISAVICLCSIGATIFYQKVIRL